MLVQGCTNLLIKHKNAKNIKSGANHIAQVGVVVKNGEHLQYIKSLPRSVSVVDWMLDVGSRTQYVMK